MEEQPMTMQGTPAFGGAIGKNHMADSLQRLVDNVIRIEKSLGVLEMPTPQDKPVTPSKLDAILGIIDNTSVRLNRISEELTKI